MTTMALDDSVIRCGYNSHCRFEQCEADGSDHRDRRAHGPSEILRPSVPSRASKARLAARRLEVASSGGSIVHKSSGLIQMDEAGRGVAH